MSENNSKKRLGLIPVAMLLFVGVAFAAVLVISFGFDFETLIHFFDGGGSVGDPVVDEFYYATLDGWTNDISNILAFEDFGAAGTLVLVQNDLSGNCNWYGLIDSTTPTTNSTHIVVGDLDGQSVTEDDALYWAVKALDIDVSSCLQDYNVSVNVE